MKGKNIILAAVMASMAFTAMGCSSNNAPSDTAETTAAVTEASSAEITTEITSDAEITSEADSNETTSAAVTTDAIAEATEAPAEGTAGSENLSAPTNKEVLRAVNEAFGIISDKSFEDDIKSARSWRLIGEDEEISADSKATPEFLLTLCMKAASFVDKDASLDDIIKTAVEKGIITDTDLSRIDMNNTAEFIKNASRIWASSAF